MTPVFADTSYWIALIFPRDAHHARALVLAQKLASDRRVVVTSDMILVEFLNFFASFGTKWRQTATQFFHSILADPNAVVLEQIGALFVQGVELYEQRPDKDWGLTDCTSFTIMTDRGIQEALTHDQHFEQAGFTALMRP